MDQYIPLIIWALVSVGFSFLCSILEAVLLSITPSFVEVKVKEGAAYADRLKELKTNIDKPLAAILTLNTIAHTVGAIMVGASAGKIEAVKNLDWSIGSFSINGEVVVATVMTLVILFLSEIIPKTIGANNWKGLAGFTTKTLNFIILALYPLVWVSQLITKALKNEKEKSVLSRTDFGVMAEIGAKEGVFDESEYNIINNLLRFKSIQAKDIMTPRTVVRAGEASVSIKDFHEANKNIPFSRIPVFKESLDNTVGYILKDKMLESLIDGKGDASIQTITRDLQAVKEDVNLPLLFEKLTANREHMSMVIDQYGGMAGIVTMEDVIETLFGMEILDEIDNVEDMQKLAREKWEQRAQKLGIVD